MKKALVIYKSTSGFTKKYAQWIAEALNADLFDAQNVSITKILDYDTIIFGGSLHASGISGIDIIKNNLPRLTDKKIAIYTTGASPVSEKVTSEIKNRNFTPDEQKKVHFFYFRGGFDFSKLDLKNKILMTLMKWKILSKKNRTPDEKGMLDAFYNPVDFTDKNNITELLEFVKEN